MPNFNIKSQILSDQETSNLSGQAAKIVTMESIGLPVPNNFILPKQMFHQLLDENPYLTLLLNKSVRTNQKKTHIGNVVKAMKRASVPLLLFREFTTSYRHLDRKNNEPSVVISISIYDQKSLKRIRPTKGLANCIDQLRNIYARGLKYCLKNNLSLTSHKTYFTIMVLDYPLANVSGSVNLKLKGGQNKSIVKIKAYWGDEKLIFPDGNPDEYIVEKLTGKFIDKKVGNQKTKSVWKNHEIITQKLSQSKKKSWKLSEKEVEDLAKFVNALHHQEYFLKEMSFIKQKEQIFVTDYILSSEHQKKIIRTSTYANGNKNSSATSLYLKPSSPGISSGKMTFINNMRDIKNVKNGDVVVIHSFDNSLHETFRKASGIIAHEKLSTSSLPYLARDIGLPLLFAKDHHFASFESGKRVTVNGQTGEIQFSFISRTKKRIIHQSRLIEKRTTTKIATKIFYVLESTDQANEVKNASGIIFNPNKTINSIGIHPKYAWQQKLQKQVIGKLADTIESVLLEYESLPIIYQLADPSPEELNVLKGSKVYSTDERYSSLSGCQRIIVDDSLLHLELEAIKLLRNKKKKQNLHLSIPFSRSPDELIQVKRIIASYGLSRSSRMNLFFTAQVPANCIDIKDLIQAGVDGVIIDGPSIAKQYLSINQNISLDNDKTNVYPYLVHAMEQIMPSLKAAYLPSISMVPDGKNHFEVVKKSLQMGVTAIAVSPTNTSSLLDNLSAIEYSLLSANTGL